MPRPQPQDIESSQGDSDVSSLRTLDFIEPIENRTTHCHTYLQKQMETFMRDSNSFIGLDRGSPVVDKMLRKKREKKMMYKTMEREMMMREMMKNQGNSSSQKNLLSQTQTQQSLGNLSEKNLKNLSSNKSMPNLLQDTNKDDRRLNKLDKSLKKAINSSNLQHIDLENTPANRNYPGSSHKTRYNEASYQRNESAPSHDRSITGLPLGGTIYLSEYQGKPENDPAHKKYMSYAARPKGHFPHPFIAGKPGLPFVSERDLEMDNNEGLPSNFLKPCVNTSAMHYNDFRHATDRYENRQREVNYYMKEHHRSNREFAKLLTPCSKMPGDATFIHGTTKPLGRLRFDKGQQMFKFTDSAAKKMLPEGYERQKYGFWK